MVKLLFLFHALVFFVVCVFCSGIPPLEVFDVSELRCKPLIFRFVHFAKLIRDENFDNAVESVLKWEESNYFSINVVSLLYIRFKSVHCITFCKSIE